MWRLFLSLTILSSLAVPANGQRDGRPDVLLIEVSGAIGPAVSDFIDRNIERAGAEDAKAVILQLDTPGGLDTSMRVIIKAILSSPVPVVTYVAPSGSRAASAGTYILYASHVAAMAPATNLGAATPIPVGPGALPGEGKEKGKGKEADKGEEKADEEKPEAASPAQAMERKVVNDAVAYIRGLAELRGRNADWAEEAVRAGSSLTAEDALAAGVIDLMAKDVPELIANLDGRTVVVRDGEVTMSTEGWRVEIVKPDWRSRLLAVITSPNVAYLLMLLGVYGLLFELYSPGALIPGIIGTISLVLALYAFHLLPVNYAGVALIVVGIGLMVAELFTPSFGALGIGGAVAFIAGSIILVDTDVEGYTVSMPLIFTFALVAAALFSATIYLAVRQRTRPIVSGAEEMIGATAEAVESFSATGRVRAHGELWSARSSRPVVQGQSLRIKSIDGLVLEVEALPEDK